MVYLYNHSVVLTQIKIGTFEICAPAPVALRVYIMQVIGVNYIFLPIGTLNWLFDR